VHDLQLWVRPEHYGTYEPYMMHWVMWTLQEYPRWPVKMTLSSDHIAAIHAAESYGFQRQQTLITMRRRTGEAQ